MEKTAISNGAPTSATSSQTVETAVNARYSNFSKAYGTSSRSFVKGIEMWKQETISNQEYVKQQEELSNSVHIDASYDLLVPQEEKSGLEILRFNLRWKGIIVLMIVWISFLLLQVIKNFTKDCSLWYWVLNFMHVKKRKRKSCFL